jgi:hypothetical protein
MVVDDWRVVNAIRFVTISDRQERAYYIFYLPSRLSLNILIEIFAKKTALLKILKKKKKKKRLQVLVVDKRTKLVPNKSVKPHNSI